MKTSGGLTASGAEHPAAAESPRHGLHQRRYPPVYRWVYRLGRMSRPGGSYRSCELPWFVCQYVPMPQQQSSLSRSSITRTRSHDFTVVLRGYDRDQVDDHIGRLNAALSQAEQARAEAEQRMNDAQRRLRQAEQRISALEQKLSDTNKQLEENSRPTLSGLGTRVEQILRLAEEQANDHRARPSASPRGSSPPPVWRLGRSPTRRGPRRRR